MKHQFSLNKQDEYNTERYAVLPIAKYIKKEWTVWCPFDKDDSNFVKVFRENGNTVVPSHIEDGKDFFSYAPEYYDAIVSNPPYSRKEDAMVRLFSLGKPFAMLINDAGLFDSKKRFALLSENPFELMIFDSRVGYIRDGIRLQTPAFKSLYLCSRLLPERFVFEKLDKSH